MCLAFINSLRLWDCTEGRRYGRSLDIYVEFHSWVVCSCQELVLYLWSPMSYSSDNFLKLQIVDEEGLSFGWPYPSKVLLHWSECPILAGWHLRTDGGCISARTKRILSRHLIWLSRNAGISSIIVEVKVQGVGDLRMVLRISKWDVAAVWSLLSVLEQTWVDLISLTTGWLKWKVTVCE